MARSLTILLAEDDYDDARLIHLALNKILPGICLSVVSDGAQVLEYLNGSGPYADRVAYPFPDVLLVDLKLPFMDGFEVLRWIRNQPEFATLPVIAMTGSPRKEDAALAQEAGANLCVLKSQGFRRLAELVIEVRPLEPVKAPVPTISSDANSTPASVTESILDALPALSSESATEPLLDGPPAQTQEATSTANNNATEGPNTHPAS